MRKGNLYRALTDLTSAVHLRPTYASAYFIRGIVYFRMVERPMADFRKTLELNPEHGA
ncbi:hypothetical protein [Hyphomicrobium sp.]|uniref:hypothetical protein n=1 Tax=Hyphomicrobium sp. TaxID=82 RepID=UPI003458303C